MANGFYNIEDNFPGGAPIDFELERIVDERGQQIQATNHIGARPFNKEEMDKISRVGTCVACHASDTVKLAGAAPTDEIYSKSIRKILDAK